jgi:ornithine carbamoyltransferase
MTGPASGVAYLSSLVWDAAGNRLHAQQAVLTWLPREDK